ncbi:hypothetical protein MPTK1_7g05380 [Marchantia polymorpha subsp. ruderalis]|uniref:Uncharacterized protein n=2 Tax=Marchantia polymorpha TaxID=3197 RepID=A0AAF6BWD7_MARPO|nr:hypothetical protein MARPO_0218s0006 [Marchantia polymorpha]BBN16321.1 hypothetical protein Mp_7g05380 [Marchantia polymorpha subsp. ruderalis]|eukprot:PTQ27126.1 hypothetical protein MARPO_0218s0006 [Marchantia polymorpha]
MRQILKVESRMISWHGSCSSSRIDFAEGFCYKVSLKASSIQYSLEYRILQMSSTVGSYQAIACAGSYQQLCFV